MYQTGTPFVWGLVRPAGLGEMVSLLEKIIGDPAFVEHIAWERHLFRPSQIIVHEGDKAHSLYLVESGTLRVTGRVELEEKRYVQPGIGELKAGDLFGELCLFQPDNRRSASVMGLTDGKLVEIDGHQLSLYLDKHPDTGYQLLKQLFGTLNRRLSRANQRVEHLFAWGLKTHDIDKYL